MNATIIPNEAPIKGVKVGKHLFINSFKVIPDRTLKQQQLT